MTNVLNKCETFKSSLDEIVIFAENGGIDGRFDGGIDGRADGGIDGRFDGGIDGRFKVSALSF